MYGQYVFWSINIRFHFYINDKYWNIALPCKINCNKYIFESDVLSIDKYIMMSIFHVRNYINVYYLKEYLYILHTVIYYNIIYI